MPLEMCIIVPVNQLIKRLVACFAVGLASNSTSKELGTCDSGERLFRSTKIAASDLQPLEQVASILKMPCNQVPHTGQVLELIFDLQQL